MIDDPNLDAQLRALSSATTVRFDAPSAGVAKRLESIRCALRRQPIPGPATDYLLVRVDEAEHWVALVGDTVVGTAPDATLRPASRFVSARHCRLHRGSGGWTVEDLGSKNGTLVNGQRVSLCSLCAGDAIQLADVTLILVGTEQPEEP
jgi:hypothetical protein